MKPTYLIVLLMIVGACADSKQDPLQLALESCSPSIQKVMASPDAFELQILYTQIDSTRSGEVVFTDHSFNVDPNKYFYPASTVKLPIAILALEWLSSFPKLSMNTRYLIENDSALHTIDEDIRQIFAVSDNDAYNRLYELLGRDHINQRLIQKGIEPVRISHRLSTSNADRSDGSEFKFLLANDTLVINRATDSELQPLDIKGLQKGKGFKRNDSLIKKPMDFKLKNQFTISAQHNLMKRLFFPDHFDPSDTFHLTHEQRERLTYHMATLPRHNGYDENKFYDSYGKFFIYGNSRERIPEHIAIFNKVGYAYGTLTETAYIVDHQNELHFILTATLLVNANEIFNDDIYEFDSIGIPFLSQLGSEIYNWELSHKK